MHFLYNPASPSSSLYLPLCLSFVSISCSCKCITGFNTHNSLCSCSVVKIKKKLVWCVCALYNLQFSIYFRAKGFELLPIASNIVNVNVSRLCFAFKRCIFQRISFQFSTKAIFLDLFRNYLSNSTHLLSLMFSRKSEHVFVLKIVENILCVENVIYYYCSINMLQPYLFCDELTLKHFLKCAESQFTTEQMPQSVAYLLRDTVLVFMKLMSTQKINLFQRNSEKSRLN